MKEDYLNLAFGKISKEKLRPWLQWLSKRKISQFGSFPEMVIFFKEFFSSEEQKSIFIVNYPDGDFDEESDFIKKELFFYALIKIFDLPETSISLLVKFYLDGTVEVSCTYADNSVLNKIIEKNLEKIDTVINQRQKDNKLSWKEFVNLFEKIESGLYNEYFQIPEF